VITAGLAGVYTSNPASTGTVVGIVKTGRRPSSRTHRDLRVRCARSRAKCITLRGTTQVLAVNGNGHTLLTGEKFGVSFEWTEE
jgi:hypothetical protein